MLWLKHSISVFIHSFIPIVHTFSNNFHHKPVQRLKLNLTELFRHRSVHHTAAASGRSRQSNTNATTQLNYTALSHTVNGANHHTTLLGFNAAPDMICECSLIPSLPFIPSFLCISRCVFLWWGWHGIGLQVARAPVSLWHWHDDHGEGKLWIYFSLTQPDSFTIQNW